MAQHAAKPHPDPAIKVFEGWPVAVLEVFKPASLDGNQLRDSPLEAVPVGTLGLRSDLVLELPQTLPAGPAIAPLEMVAQEVETASRDGIDDPGLLRMEPQSRRGGPFLDLGQRPLGFRLTTAQNHKVVRVTHHRIA